MTFRSFFLTFLSIPLLLCNCSTTLKGRVNPAYTSFTKKSNYPKTRQIYQDKKLLAKATKENTHITIHLSKQRASLLVNNQVALDTPCCTGKAGKRTPKGHFKITSKIRNKRSNIFGSLYYKGRKVFGGDRRKYHGRYTKYVGASLPYWMRITDDGIGMHYSAYVHRHPGSNGCIRLPRTAASTFFSKTKVGTPVLIISK